MIKYEAPFLDGSGYGQASRNAIQALNEVGVKFTTKIRKYSDEKKSMGKGGELALKYENCSKNYDVKIIQLTPNFYPNCVEAGKYLIGFLFWEVVGVDPMWVWGCNLMDEIWTSSYEHARVLKTFGVISPIRVVPVPMEFWDLPKDKHDDFRFYSIFQWSERKNPKALIQNYWKAFEGVDDVVLRLKTYGANYTEREKGAIKDQINDFKKEQEQGHYPKIDLFLEEMSNDEIMNFHNQGDVFVSAHRGEGWGMPQMEAMSLGKPIISTNWGGIHHWLSNKDSWLIPFEYVNVFNMGHIGWYSTDHLWANIKSEELRKAMFEAYYNRELTRDKGRLARKLVRNTFSFKTVGNLMKDYIFKEEL